MSMMCCKGCGFTINTDDNPEAFYFEGPDGVEIEMDYVLCDECKDARYRRIVNLRNGDIA